MPFDKSPASLNLSKPFTVHPPSNPNHALPSPPHTLSTWPSPQTPRAPFCYLTSTRMDGFFHQKCHLYLSLTLTCARHHSNVHSPEKEATSSILPGYRVHTVVLMLSVISHLPHHGPCPIFWSRPQVLSVSHGSLPGSHFSTLLYAFLVASSNRSFLPQFQARLLSSRNAYRVNSCQIIKSVERSRHSEWSTVELGVRPSQGMLLLPSIAHMHLT